MSWRHFGAKPLSDQRWLIVNNWTLFGDSIQGNLNRNSYFSFKKIQLQTPSANSRPFCLGLSVLTRCCVNSLLLVGTYMRQWTLWSLVQFCGFLSSVNWVQLHQLCSNHWNLHSFDTSQCQNSVQLYIEGILPKESYQPCLPGYPRYRSAIGFMIISDSWRQAQNLLLGIICPRSYP